MVAAEVLAFFQRVNGAAVRALRATRASYVKINPGVAAVNLHVCFGAGAIQASLRVQL